jgi:hypothetical protein
MDYNYYWNLQFTNNVIIINSKVLLPKEYVTIAEFGYSNKVVWFSCFQRLLNYLAFNF